MPICRPSATEMRGGATLLALGLALGCAAPGAAQDSGSSPIRTPQNTVKQQGDAAMERLKDAVAKQKVQPAAGPTALPDLP